MDSSRSYNYITINEALRRLQAESALNLSEEEILLDEASGLILAEDVISQLNVPFSNRSAVDGFALCSESISLASPSNPISLKLATTFDSFSCSEAYPVSTGSEIPKGADAVVMKEDTVLRDNELLVLKSVPKFGNISLAGEDIKAGDIIARKGTILTPPYIATIASANIIRVKVYSPIKIGLVTVGSELEDLTEVVTNERIIDTSSRLLKTTISQYKFLRLKWYGIVPDKLDEIANIISRAIDENDLLLTTGGTGPGASDLTVMAAEKVGVRLLCKGLAIRPGRPTSIGVFDYKPVFFLSGFPVASYVALRFLVFPYITNKLSLTNFSELAVPATLTKRVFGNVGYDTFVRVKVFWCGNSMCAEPIMLKGSGILSSLIKANGFILVPRDVEGFEEGENVKVFLI